MLVLTVFILMRHYDEWEEKRTFKCDKYDIELCRIVLEIQMYSQRLFFGKYAEMYFDNSQRERLEKQVSSYRKRSDDIFNGLSEVFSREDVLKKACLTEDAARQVIYRWVKDGYCKKIVGKRKREMGENNSESKTKKLRYIPIAVRNNNPLNIIKTNIKWKGQVKHPSKFCVFMEPKWGWRAALIIICRTYRKRGLTTVWKIINSWAPPTENKTESYAKFVAFGSHVGLDTPLPSIYINPDLYIKILTNMAIVESGSEYVGANEVICLKESIDAFLKEFPENNKITK